VGAAEGLRVLKPGVAEGVFDGGCLSIFVEAVGTPYAPEVSEGILFLEDIGTKPYQWDRQLLHLRYAGQLDGVKGIVLGDMTQCVPAEDQELLERAILHALRDFAGPVGIGLRSGHVGAGNVTLPLGAQARLDLGGEPRLEFFRG
jgi:muramoyltetrapeptide carboxypeptidase